MFDNKYPKTGSKNGSIRYYTSFYMGDPLLFKVHCVRSWHDKENDCWPVTCKILDAYITSRPESSSDHFVVDNVWQLQETLEDAIKLMIVLIFHKNSSASYSSTPPWR